MPITEDLAKLDNARADYLRAKQDLETALTVTVPALLATIKAALAVMEAVKADVAEVDEWKSYVAATETKVAAISADVLVKEAL